MGFPSLSPDQAVALRAETAISVAINAVVPTAVIWVAGIAPPQRLIGPHDILSVIVPASGAATLLMTIILTLVVRRKVAQGRVPTLRWPRAERGLARLIPQPLLPRAVVCALLAIVALVPITFAAVAVAGILPLSREGAVLFNVFYGALVGLTMTRFIVLPAMADTKD